MGSGQSRSKNKITEIEAEFNKRDESDNVVGCCLKLQKMRASAKSNFACCIKGETQDITIVYGDNNNVGNTSKKRGVFGVYRILPFFQPFYHFFMVFRPENVISRNEFWAKSENGPSFPKNEPKVHFRGLSETGK